ncbi:hypothetical protein HZA44_00420, partial [Candidatus Peregrinibacteria bacterium]|nr:hypothetical protein [Candidatus Peregrinibacteria bacterium]
SIKVVSILPKTNTLLDDAHFVNASTFAQLSATALVRSLNDLGILKWFYEVADENSVPVAFSYSFSAADLRPIRLGGKSYIPILIGSEEAAMMIGKGIFKKAGDTIENLFGNAVIISGILPKTGTMLDDFHYVPSGLNWVMP